MPQYKDPFAKAHYQKWALNKTTTKRIQDIYGSAAKDVEKQLSSLTMMNPSDSLRKVYLENLQQDISKSVDSLNRQVYQTVTEAGEQAGNIAVSAQNEMMSNFGLNVRGAYSYIPRQEVQNIVSGSLYGHGWNLSQAIWKSGAKVKSDVEKIIAEGLTANKPIKDIADALATYVSPTARKPWDWSKVYPGTAQQVDYNAQRLARTMIQHAYQQSLVQSMLYNPFCTGIVWYSVGIHGRTCELCMERDGQVFPVKDLPLDHPNGLCYFEPAMWKMDDIANRLADWAEGGEDKAIELYISKGLGTGKNTTAAKRTTDAVRAGVSTKRPKQKPFDPEEWMAGVKKNTEEYMLSTEQGWTTLLTYEEQRALERYTGSAYEEINAYLRAVARGEEYNIADRFLKTIEDMESAFDKFALQEDIYVRRGSTASDLASLMGGDYAANKQMIQDLMSDWVENFDSFEEAVAHLNNQTEGLAGVFHGYTSTSSLWDRGFMGKFEYIFRLPKGTRASSIMRISMFDTSEGELLLGAGAKVRVVKVLPSDGHRASRIRVFLEVIP